MPTTDTITESRNLIFFGAPGTGKSHKVDKIVAEDNTAVRTTFHPDSDYASFVGAYKPTMDGPNIVYKFVPQTFLKAYIQAWEKMAEKTDGEEPARQYLIIEEINRGNCAQIFGDLFQLLDRDDKGYSKYPIIPDVDLSEYLRKWFSGEGNRVDSGGKEGNSPNLLGSIPADRIKTPIGDTKTTLNDILSGRKLVLPPNLYIWATMNTSDQSLFPMDSAFKRRWAWKYSPIREPKNNKDGTAWKPWTIKVNSKSYQWWGFLEKINKIIRDLTHSADKQLGYFFVNLPNGQSEIDAEMFVSKVVFYLWNDVFKDCELDDRFQQGGEQLEFDDFFNDDGDVNEEVVAGFLGKLLDQANDPASPETEAGTPPALNPSSDEINVPDSAS